MISQLHIHYALKNTLSDLLFYHFRLILHQISFCDLANALQSRCIEFRFLDAIQSIMRITTQSSAAYTLRQNYRNYQTSLFGAVYGLRND